MDKKTLMVSTIALLIVIAMVATGCQTGTTKAPIREDVYSAELEERIKAAEAGVELQNQRPDYLPEAMFKELPEFPSDFYSVRTLVRTGRITDLANLEEKYWLQPEFFPRFEETGVPLLLNAPKDRWGAYGLASYPADSLSHIVAGDTLELYFFMKSSYLVETFQGVNLEPVFPSDAEISDGVKFPDGTTRVVQKPGEISEYFNVEISPNPFILDPNFPIYKVNGTRKIHVRITAKENTPPGNYVIGLDTGAVPKEYEEEWIKQYLNLYASTSMTRIERPYYQAFVIVSAPPATETGASETTNEVEEMEETGQAS